MKLVLLLVWNLIEIVYHNYAGWLAAGQYAVNRHCTNQLFGPCAINT